MDATRHLDSADSGPGEGSLPLLVVDGIHVVRGGRAVLSIGRLEVAERETVTVVGPNGAGKSTLLLTLASLIRPDRGRLLYREAPVTAGEALRYRRRIGLVLADPLLLDTSVFNNVAAGLRFRGLPGREVRPRVTEWLDRLGVGHLAGRPARHISSGEAQRVSLARALVLDPDVLLLDEPFASVDPATRARLLDDLERLLGETRVACVLVTHDLDEAVRLGDRMAVVIGGQLRQCDTPQRVLAAPVDEDVAAFVGAETRLPGRVVAEHEGMVLVDVGTGHVEAASDVGVGRSVLCCLRPEDITLWSPDGRASGPGTLEPGRGPHPPVPVTDGGGGFVSSARNQLPGRVGRIVPQGPLVRITVDCGVTLVAVITRASAQDMGLAEGASVTATFKASAVHLIPLAGTTEP